MPPRQQRLRFAKSGDRCAFPDSVDSCRLTIRNHPLAHQQDADDRRLAVASALARGCGDTGSVGNLTMDSCELGLRNLGALVLPRGEAPRNGLEMLHK